MKFSRSIIILPFLFTGCLYFNDTGISTHMYDNCKEYYDACGNYRKECAKNFADYSEIKEGAVQIGEEIKQSASDLKKSLFNPTKKCCHEPCPCKR